MVVLLGIDVHKGTHTAVWPDVRREHVGVVAGEDVVGR
jgi:hypothetical protein